MVHITYRHGPNSSEEQREILKEYHFFISEDRCHDFHYVRHCFIMFYDHLKGKNIQIDTRFGLMDVLVSSKMHAYFNGCVHCIKTTKFHICGTILRLGMVKESMMKLEHVSKQPYEERN